MIKFVLSLVLIVTVFACRKTVNEQPDNSEMAILNNYLNLPDKPYNYSSPDLPLFMSDQFITIQSNTPDANRVSDWGASLGRVLFYDQSLSSNYTIACASCHQQAFGFTDTSLLSKGVNGLTRRHSMSLVNAAYYSNGRFFWDERAYSLEDQVLRPIQDHVEMNMSLDSLVNRLKAKPYYPILFKYAFGSDSISSYRISKALSQFIRSIISYRSKYDKGRVQVSASNISFPNFSAEENLGKQIFFNHSLVNCSGCHTTDLFVLDNPRNNGLEMVYDDSGIFIHTGKSSDAGKFKSPSLRNAALRSRFMHDGSIIGLEGVIEHYNNGIISSPNLDEHLKDPVSGVPAQMGLNEEEKRALVAFLKTLTDYELIADPKYSNPFR